MWQIKNNRGNVFFLLPLILASGVILSIHSLECYKCGASRRAGGPCWGGPFDKLDKESCPPDIWNETVQVCTTSTTNESIYRGCWRWDLRDEMCLKNARMGPTDCATAAQRSQAIAECQGIGRPAEIRMSGFGDGSRSGKIEQGPINCLCQGNLCNNKNVDSSASFTQEYKGLIRMVGVAVATFTFAHHAY